MSENLKNDILSRVTDAIDSDGYLVMITKLVKSKDEQGGDLHHCYFTNNFVKTDIMPTLEEHSKLLKAEISSEENVTGQRAPLRPVIREVTKVKPVKKI